MILLDGKRQIYGSGAELEKTAFEKRYQIDALRVAKDAVELILAESAPMVPMDEMDSLF